MEGVEPRLDEPGKVVLDALAHLADGVRGGATGQVLARQLDRQGPRVVVGPEVLEVDRLGVGRDDRHRLVGDEALVVLPVELVVAAVVEVADAAGLGIDHLDRHRRLLVCVIDR